MGRLVKVPGPNFFYVVQWHTQVVNITTNLKVEANFNLPEISATNVVM